MTIEYEKLKKAPRLLIEAELKPMQGDRFQPTGFADLGAARYTRPDGTEMLLVESNQSVANRMEIACWDTMQNDYIDELKALPFIRVNYQEDYLTNSVLEAHRINSEYIMNSDFKEKMIEEISLFKDRPVDWKKVHTTLFKYDPGSLLHGTFLEEIDGRIRVTRAISGFIEATGVKIAESGGVKNNYVQPSLKEGEGNVPYPRTEFTAKEIKAYFNLDLALIQGYGLANDAENLLIALSLFKIRKFLSTGLRLRTACDLEVQNEIKVKRPTGFVIPSEEDLLDECKKLAEICTTYFAPSRITDVVYIPSKKEKKKKETEEPDE